MKNQYAMTRITATVALAAVAMSLVACSGAPIFAAQ